MSLLLLPLAAGRGGALRAQTAQSGQALVVRGGTLIDPRTGTTLANATIVIEGERIRSVTANGPAPPGAQVVDATGKFVLPGLWDSHAHTRDFDGILNINHGVTSTMDMGNILDWIHVLAESREKQMTFGPRIFPQGMSISGTHGQHQWNARTPEQARFAARQNIEAGAAFLKVYQHATPEIIKAVAEEADKAGLNLAAHLVATDARVAIENGVRLVAHGSGIAPATMPDAEQAAKIKRREMRELYGGSAATSNALQDTAMFDDLITLMVAKNVRYEPNIIQQFRGIYPSWDRHQLEMHRLSMLPALHFIPEMFVRMWATDFPYDPYPAPPALFARLKKGYDNHMLFMKKFAAAGGKLTVGTDAYYHVAPGLALWQEMEMMAEGGVAPLQVLQAATVNPAEFVHKEKDLGTIEPGKLADLIVLAKNPLEHISNIRTLEVVVQHGKVQPLGYRSDYHVVIPRPWQRVNSSLPLPYISAVEPSAVPIGTDNLVLTITGKDFNEENRVLWGDHDLRVIEVTPTVTKVSVPKSLVSAPGTFKVHMITGGRVHAPSLTFGEVMVTFGRTFKQRWNGQTLSKTF